VHTKLRVPFVCRASARRRDCVERLPAPLGAAVAAGVAVMAPRIRGLLHTVLRLPQPVLGLAEDYLALRLGGEALGLSTDDLKQIAGQTVEEVKDLARPALQSIGAGSM